MTPRPTEDDVVALLTHLVSIDSVNPSLVSGAAGEEAIATFVGRWLADAGLDVEMREVLPGRPNVVARLGGRTGGGRSLILNAHMDTVGVAGMERPFEPAVAGDRLFGRGAYDMKGGLAAVMLAAQHVALAGGADGDLIVTAVADEEYASAGTQDVVAQVAADAAIVTEPTGLRLCAAHKGFAWIGVETHGRAAHGSRPDLGVDAVAHMGRVLGEIEALGARLAASQRHTLLGTGSVHASLIEGGQELSSYPERCRLHLERRTVPGESANQVLDEVRAILSALQAVDPSFDAAAELLLWRDPFEVSIDERIVRCVSDAAAVVLGTAPAVYGDTPWMDAALLAHAGIPTVVFGPGGAGAHAIEEWVSIREVAGCAEVLARAAMLFTERSDST